MAPRVSLLDVFHGKKSMLVALAFSVTAFLAIEVIIFIVFAASSGEHSRIQVRDGTGKTIYDVAGSTLSHINFSYFELERSFDTVRVYDGSSIVDCASLGANERRASCSRLLEQLSGAALPRTLVASSGAMLITFRSDGSVQQRGFLATYSSLTATTPSPARRRVPSPAPLRFSPSPI